MCNRVLGIDVGTAFLQSAEKNNKGEIEFKTIRNSFIELSGYDDSEIESILKRNNWQYIVDGNHYYILGEDSLVVSRMFPKVEIRRPMQDGVLNKNEDKKMLVIAKMIENIIGEKSSDDNSLICFCVSSDVVDTNIDNVFHKNRLEGIFKRLGFETKCIEEGESVIFSENPVIEDKNGVKIPYSGLGISFGAGRSNAVLSYRGLKIIGMSCNRGGDYIDQKVSDQTNTPISQVINIKETKLDFENLNMDDDVIFALDCYYTNLISYVMHHFAKKFNEVKSQFESPIPIIVAGGTSMPKGFTKKIETVLKDLNLPFEIKEVKRAANPRNSVVAGCLIQAIISQKKLKESKIEEALG